MKRRPRRAAALWVAAIMLAGACGWAAVADASAAPDTAAMRSALEMMRRTERAFARSTAEIGLRNGFLMYFATDAIMPPDSTSARLTARPAPTLAPPTTLEWEPMTGEVSRSLDLGWLAGPFRYRDASGERHHGVYFSIWRRGADGLWRVALDAGIGTPGPAPEFADSLFRASPGPRWADSLDATHAAAAAAELSRIETDFLAAAARDPRAAWGQALSASARLHRDGHMPLLARDSILARVAGERPGDAHVIRAEVSAAGDLGWTFGVEAYPGEHGTTRAALSRVWRRDPQGRWRIVVDVASRIED